MQSRTSSGVIPFYLLACIITWACAWPTASAWLKQQSPEPWALALAGLSAFGPLLATVVVGKARGQLAQAFRPWRAPVSAVLLAFFVPSAIRVASALLAGPVVTDSISQQLFIPTAPERWAALLIFPLGEEFGWRGFAYPRLFDRFGPLRASLVLGFMWSVWHLGYCITPEGTFDTFTFTQMMIELPLYSIILTWLFERGGRSLLIPLSFHATAHLFHLELAGRDAVVLHGTHFCLMAVAALFAAQRLSQMGRASPASSGR